MTHLVHPTVSVAVAEPGDGFSLRLIIFGHFPEGGIPAAVGDLDGRGCSLPHYCLLVLHKAVYPGLLEKL